MASFILVNSSGRNVSGFEGVNDFNVAAVMFKDLLSSLGWIACVLTITRPLSVDFNFPSVFIVFKCREFITIWKYLDCGIYKEVVLLLIQRKKPLRLKRAVGCAYFKIHFSDLSLVVYTLSYISAKKTIDNNNKNTLGEVPF